MMANFSNTASSSPYADPEDSAIVVKAKEHVPEPLHFSYTEKDVILYNLGIGATEKELQWTYEGDEDFSALPTFGVIPPFHASGGIPLDWLPNYSPVSEILCLCRFHLVTVTPLAGCIDEIVTWRAIFVYQGPNTYKC